MSQDIQPIESMELKSVSAKELARQILNLSSADIEFVKLQLRMTDSTNKRNSFEASSRQDGESNEVSCLTARETEVLVLIASGYTRRDISSALSISRNTAATHIASLYRKLDISSIAEATHIAIRNDVVRLM